jgi:hypothetical protein
MNSTSSVLFTIGMSVFGTSAAWSATSTKSRGNSQAREAAEPMARWRGPSAFAGALCFYWILLTLPVQAQDAAVPAAQNSPAYTAAQIDQMLAPIALYPDDLLGPILMASTYPQEIVEADRWLKNPANASLDGAQLAQALQQEPWDASVKSLVPFPQIVSMIDENLSWTEQLGDAFLAQQNDVMDAVQQLRTRAQSAGTLASTPHESVTNNDEGIEIAPADANTVDVPVYDPNQAYGEWPYSDYPPDDFSITGYPVGSFISIGIVAPLWGWDHWDWRHHRLAVSAGPGAGPPGRFAPWRHDPVHRGGVPYGDGPTRARFEGNTDIHAANGGFRGYTATVPSRAAVPLSVPVERPAVPIRTVETPIRAPAPIQRSSPPAFESFGRGPEVHMQEQRGASNRISARSGGGSVHR